MDEKNQEVLNIGIVGHIDHGKTTLLEKLTGVWASRHSEELKRGITIRLGYADATIRKCEKGHLTTKETCECKGKTKEIRKVSFVDAPGHEMLMATMLSGAAIIDAAILVIAANEPCPQPQTKEHLLALTIKKIKNIIIVQNKIDLVEKKQAIENYKKIKALVKNTAAEKAPIIPVSAQQELNIDTLLEIITKIPSPKRDTTSIPIFYTARSFDINKPSTPPQKLKGGILGGVLKQGTLETGQTIEIKPGLIEKNKNKVIKTKIASLVISNKQEKKAFPGPLAIQTELDPELTKGDTLAGNIVSLENKLPEVAYTLKFSAQLFPTIVGAKKELKVSPLNINEPILLSINTSTTIGRIEKIDKKKNQITASLKIPVCALKGSTIGIARNIDNKWRLIGHGIVE